MLVTKKTTSDLFKEMEGWLIVDAVDCDKYSKGQPTYLQRRELGQGARVFSWRELFESDFGVSI